MSDLPLDTACFSIYALAELFDGDLFTAQRTVDCLNLTQDITKYVAAYCVNPPRDDDCPFDFCPNPEIAGTDLITYFVFLPY